MKIRAFAFAASLVLLPGANDAWSLPSGIYSFGSLFAGEGTGASGDTCQVSTDNNNGTIIAAFNAAGGATLLNGLVVSDSVAPTNSNGNIYSGAQYSGVASLTPGGNTITFDQASFVNTSASRVRFKRYNASSDSEGNITLTFIVTVRDCEAPFKAFFHVTANTPPAP